jgi:hypothetical protein
MFQYRYQLNQSEYVATENSVAVAFAMDDLKKRAILLASGFIAIGVAASLSPSSLPGLLFALLSLCVISHFWRQSARRLKFPALPEIEVTFDNDGVLERSANSSHSWPWTSLRRIHDLPAVVVIEFVGWDHVAVPNRVWSDADERSKFLDVIRTSAPHLLPDIHKTRVSIGEILLIIGSIAGGLDFGILAKWLLYRRGFDLCFQAADLAIFIGILVVIILALVGLGRLQKKRPSVAIAIAVLLICLFVTLPLIGLMERLLS